MNTTKERDVTFLSKEDLSSRELSLVAEEPLSIMVQGRPYSASMRTPGDEKAQVVGFCFTEALIDGLEDFDSCIVEEKNQNLVRVMLKPSRYQAVENILTKKGFVTQSSSAISPREMVADLMQGLRPSNHVLTLSFDRAMKLLDGLPGVQPLRKTTGASHAAAIYDSNDNPLAVAEDVGRHNALDKVIGKVLLENSQEDACIAVLSSRVSYDMVKKAARAGLAMVLSVSRPTAMAVELAGKLNMTLACLGKKEGLFVFCGKNRFG